MKRKTIVGVITIIAIIVAGIVAGCVEKGEVAPPTPIPSEPAIAEDLSGRNVLMVIAPEDFRDEELFEPKAIFEQRGAKVTISSTSTDTAKGMIGGEVKPDLKISEVDVENYDAIVIVGGVGSREYLWEDEELRTLVTEAYGKDKVVAAICISPVVLAKAGVLEGKKATVFPDRGAINELEQSGATYVDQSVVVFDKVVTGRDTASADEFALKISSLLSILVPLI
ncbi:MAG: DJ-1/PfpI family protein [archaeon]|nr:DJ-1/PfpI family protein [archaeon]